MTVSCSVSTIQTELGVEKDREWMREIKKKAKRDGEEEKELKERKRGR